MGKLIRSQVPKGRVMLLVLMDVLIIQFSTFMAIWVRYDFAFTKIPRMYLSYMLKYAPIHTIFTLGIFVAFGLYRSLWNYASISEIIKIFMSCMCTSIVQCIGMSIMGYHMPRSFGPMVIMILFISTASVRFSYRILRRMRIYKDLQDRNRNMKQVMVIGAGEAASVIIKELQQSERIRTEVVCIIDDDKRKQGRMLQGCRIVGGREKILSSVEKYQVDEIVVAMPSAEPRQIKSILNICKNTPCELRVLPGVYQLINGEVSASRLRKVEIEDLLGREPVKVDLDSIMGYVHNKVVLVTGGGGSIGSEICRQLAKQYPKQLIIFDIYENNAYEIQQELKRKYPELNLTVLIGSVRNTNRINMIFEKYRPQIVYHAAAHKHVPLMEDSPNEAIKNNVFGTYKTATAADKYGVERFVLISTDKAVNPTNIMGASKRICEMIVQCINNQSKTEFVAVRFGNVLGSNGSVIPLFKKQIACGGPVTVTHRDIIRYFMTIPEAVSLVLQAGAYAKGGEIFVLEMGEPVRIDDMARNLIRLSGYTPDVDIKVEYTGLRPGEKLYEELLMDEEGLQETANKLIHIGKPIDMNDNVFKTQLAELKVACYKDDEQIKEKVAAIVTTYKLSGPRNKN